MNETAPGVEAWSDADWMRAALSFGRRWLGATATNPAVGALIVDAGGRVVGRGATRPGGRPHAETQALEAAGAAARGATLYVTLEPCSHHGETPPCAEAIVAAGIGRVVSAMEDPDPRVSGRGHALLRAAGVDVATDVLREEAARDHRGHISRVLLKRPAVTLKLAETADGYAAGGVHDARLRITGPAAESRVHIWRALHDAILIGAGTAEIDDPLLTVRLAGLETRRPLRTVFDARANLSPRSRLAATARDWPTLLVTGVEAPAGRLEQLAATGIEIEVCEVDAAGRLALPEALGMLALRGVSRIFCEGGPTLAAHLLAEDLVDAALVLRAEKPLGRPGLPALSAEARALLNVSSLWRRRDGGFHGADRWDDYERVR